MISERNCWNDISTVSDCVFYSPNRLGHRRLVGEVLPFCQDTERVFYSSNWLGYSTLVRRVPPFCRDTVAVFYSPNRLGHRRLVGGRSHTFLSRYSRYILQLQLTGPQDTRWGSLTFLSRYSRSILQPQTTGL